MNNKIPKQEIPVIPAEDWERIVLTSKIASKVLSDPDFAFLLDYFNKTIDSSIELVATNSIKDVVETTTNKDGYSKSVKTSKEEQLSELAGRIKLSRKFLEDLVKWSNEKSSYLKLEKEGTLIISKSKEDDKKV